MTAALDEIHRREWAKVVAALARSYGDLDLAEDATAEAFASAVEHWPVDGMPDRPGAWLLTVARRKALDRLRRESTRNPRQAEAHRALELRAERFNDEADMGPLTDDRLRLVFTCCHPALAPDAQIALTLRLIAGLTTAEVARAFWVPEPTMAQRLVRAKHKIAAANIPYRVPAESELDTRLAGVLRVVYLVFREGYTPSSGETLVRVDLCDEAIRLARLVAELLPEQNEPQALLALLLLQHSRWAARTDDAGDLVLMADQDRERWDRPAIAEGLALASVALRRGRTPYALQAAIAACHAAAPDPDEVNWPVIAGLYGELARIDSSPAVVAQPSRRRGRGRGSRHRAGHDRLAAGHAGRRRSGPIELVAPRGPRRPVATAGAHRRCRRRLPASDRAGPHRTRTSLPAGPPGRPRRLLTHLAPLSTSLPLIAAADRHTTGGHLPPTNRDLATRRQIATSQVVICRRMVRRARFRPGGRRGERGADPSRAWRRCAWPAPR